MSRYRFRDHLGRLSPYPTEKEVALHERLAKYLRPKESPSCPVCGCEALYVETDECVFCMAKDKWVEATANPSEYPVSLEGAIDGDFDHILTPEPCQKGPHLVSRSLDGKKGCHTCKSQVSPRTKAVKSGEKWYTPKHPCRYCGKVALKRVYDGACQGCNPDLGKGYKNAMDEPTRLLMENAPATVIDRDTAVTMGLSAYRTGKPCTHGHTGWRYVSTRNCMDCRKAHTKS